MRAVKLFDVLKDIAWLQQSRKPMTLVQNLAIYDMTGHVVTWKSRLAGWSCTVCWASTQHCLLRRILHLNCQFYFVLFPAGRRSSRDVRSHSIPEKKEGQVQTNHFVILRQDSHSFCICHWYLQASWNTDANVSVLSVGTCAWFWSFVWRNCFVFAGFRWRYCS